MDDPALTGEEGGDESLEAERQVGPRSALGPAASLVVVGVLLGLAVGWVVWRGVRDSPAGADSDAAAPLPGAAAGTVFEGVDISNDPVLGPEDAPVTIVEFSDFECPFCSRFARQTAPRLRSQYGDDIRWIFVNNPLQSIHPRAYDLALAGECAHEQEKFWEWYDAAFSDRYGTSDGGIAMAAQSIGLDEARFESCYREADHAAEVAADLAEAQKFYILGTPTFFLNGQRIEGALPAETFATTIDSILAIRNN
ncbi:hypothetical protein BH18GEM1_BH18GEM1_03960 [soil metagenome]